MALDPDVLAYYERGAEDARLRDGVGRLELLRTQDVLRRALPPAPARVLDVGGASGVHAEWLAADGHQVELLDPVPLHVDQAGRCTGVTARLGDARELPYQDASFDVVLLLGPLYHLHERADRLRALREARRVARPGGLVAAATISRYAPLHDALLAGRYVDPEVRERHTAILATGRQHARPGEEFTTAYFHEPAEIPGEFADAGLTGPVTYGLEGAVWLLGGAEEQLADAGRLAAVLHSLRAVETVPGLAGVSAHLLTTARTPEAGA